MEPSEVYVEALFGNLGLPWVHLGASSGILGPFGAILAPCWIHFTPFLLSRSGHAKTLKITVKPH